MNGKRITKLVIAASLVIGIAVALTAASADTWWLAPLAMGLLAALILGPITRIYQRGSRQVRRLLLSLGGLALTAVLALYTWATLTSPPEEIEWLFWAVVMAFPLVLGGWLALIARRDLGQGGETELHS
jgi:apolipoprotein N-acyltransferase